MTENRQHNNPVMDTQSQPNTVLRVPTLKRPNLPYQHQGSRQYKMMYVDQSGRLHEEICTKEVWKQAMELFGNVRSDFVLTISPAEGVISIREQAKPMAMLGFNQEGVDNPQHLVVERQKSGRCIVNQIPEKIPGDVADDMLRFLEDHKSAKVGDRVGRCTIVRVAQEEGEREIISFKLTR